VTPQVNCICYDKTGTLTTDGLQLSCVQPTTPGAAGGRTTPAFSASVSAPECATPLLDTGFRALLAACHGLTHVAGALAGDPLELQTFVATGAALDEPHTASGADLAPLQAATPSLSARVRLPVAAGKAAPPLAGDAGNGSPTAAAAGGVLHIVSTFDFVPRLQRMSTLVEDVSGVLGGGAGVTYAFVKGSPEAIASLCDPATLPPDFSAVVQGYTRRGFRVLGAGSKVYTGSLPLPGAGGADALRAAAESGITFRGLIVLENPLKPQSAPTIARLRKEAALPQVSQAGRLHEGGV
jgi:magnesium-transporting ATPase (P-type)